MASARSRHSDIPSGMPTHPVTPSRAVPPNRKQHRGAMTVLGGLAAGFAAGTLVTALRSSGFWTLPDDRIGMGLCLAGGTCFLVVLAFTYSLAKYDRPALRAMGLPAFLLGAWLAVAATAGIFAYL